MSDEIPVEVITAISDVALLAQQQDAVHAFITACAKNPGWPKQDKYTPAQYDTLAANDERFYEHYIAVMQLPASLTSTISLTAVQPHINTIYADLDLILKAAKPEVPAVFKLLQDGQLSGLTYFTECACLVGSIARLRKTGPFDMPTIPTSHWRPIERFVRPIREGHTPNTHYIARLFGRLMSSWMKANP